MSAEAQQLAGEQPGPAGAKPWKVALPFLLLAVIMASPFYRVWYRWSDQEDYYTHGPLVPFISAYLVLRKRKKLTGEDPPDAGALYAGGIGAAVLYFAFNQLKWDKRWLFAVLFGAAIVYLVYHLRRLKPEPWKPGLFVLIPGLILCVVAGVHEIVSVGWFFCVIVTIGVVLYYLGKRVAWLLAFPLIFLFSSVPLPEYKVQQITMPLKKFATANAVRILRSQVVQVYCERQGARIEFPGRPGEEPKEVTVGAVCSGLRSLIALISFGLLFAYITPLSMTKKVILFLASVPASFIANLARILTLALVTYQWNAATATGDQLWKNLEAGPLESLVPNLRQISNTPVHDFTGIMIFVVAFIGLFALERLLTYLELRVGRRRSDFWVLLLAAPVIGHLAGVAVGLKYPTLTGRVIAAAIHVAPYVAILVSARRLKQLHGRLRSRDAAEERETAAEAEKAVLEGADV